jgi:predicted Zn-dependent protease
MCKLAARERDTKHMSEQLELCNNIIETAIKHAGKRTDGVEVTVSGSNLATSRFANNSMTQNQSPITESVSVRVLIDGRQARLSGDQTSVKAVQELVDNTISAAKLLERDPDLPELVTPDETNGRAPDRFDRDTADIDPDGRAGHIKEMIDVAKASGLVGAGTYSSGEWYTAIGNSAGIFQFHHETSAEASITMRIGDSAGWAKAQSPRARDVKPADLARRAAEKAQRGINPIEIPPGRYKVILEPAAVLDLLWFLWYDFSATSHLDKVSSLLNKVGQKVFEERINITDDYEHPLQSGTPFDGEGMSRKVVKLVEKGVFQNMVYGQRSAKKLKKKATGHALQEPNVLGEYPQNLVVGGGNTSLEQMIADADRAILVTRVWYVRVVDPATVLITGLTQDGTFLVENGQIKSGVKNMRFNISVLEMLTKVLSLGPSLRTSGEEGSPAVIPPMTVADFNFTELSLF